MYGVSFFHLRSFFVSTVYYTYQVSPIRIFEVFKRMFCEPCTSINKALFISFHGFWVKHSYIECIYPWRCKQLLCNTLQFPLLVCPSWLLQCPLAAWLSHWQLIGWLYLHRYVFVGGVNLLACLIFQLMSFLGLIMAVTCTS